MCGEFSNWFKILEYIIYLFNVILENLYVFGVFYYLKKKKRMSCFDIKCSLYGVFLVFRYFSRYLFLIFWFWVRYNLVYGIFLRFLLWNFNCDIFLFINNVSIICFKRNVFFLVYFKLIYIYIFFKKFMILKVEFLISF